MRRVRVFGVFVTFMTFTILGVGPACGGRARSDGAIPATGGGGASDGVETMAGRAGLNAEGGVGGSVAGAVGSAGEPSEAGASGSPDEPTAIECQHDGKSARLPSGLEVCDCLPGTWGNHCEVNTLQVLPGGCALGSDFGVRCWGPRAPQLAGAYRSIVGNPARADTDYIQLCGVKMSAAAEGEVVCTDPKLAIAEPMKQLAVGLFGLCGIKGDDSVTCWGRTLSSSPDPASKFRQISVGENHACGVHLDDHIECWGSNAAARTMVPPGLRAKTVTAGSGQTCALGLDGAVSCWGAILAVPDGAFESLAFGNEQLCGVRVDHTAFCQGSELVAPSGEFTSVSGTQPQACGIRANGSVVCWGTGHEPPSGRFTALAVGSTHGCGLLLDGRMSCWGPRPDSLTLAGSGYRALAMGKEHVCAIARDGQLECKPTTGYGQALPPMGNFESLNAGQWNTCAIRSSDHSLACWGLAESESGLASPPAGKFSRVDQARAIGDLRACGLTIDGTIQCWGRVALWPGTFSQAPYRTLGIGHRMDCALTDSGSLDCPATLALTPGPFSDLAVRPGQQELVCALNEQRDVECWLMGIGTQKLDSTHPGPFVKLSASVETNNGTTLCALSDIGQVECWGAFTRPKQL